MQSAKKEKNDDNLIISELMRPTLVFTPHH